MAIIVVNLIDLKEKDIINMGLRLIYTDEEYKMGDILYSNFHKWFIVTYVKRDELGYTHHIVSLNLSKFRLLRHIQIKLVKWLLVL